MVSTGSGGGEVTDRRMSTVVPAEVAGENRMQEVTNMDLAMRLHYLRVVYYFPAGGAAAGLTVPELKYALFLLLEVYYPACGRIRLSESGRAVIKCNDSGVRVVEARCGLTVDQLLPAGHHRDLAADNVLGPDVHFSPLVIVQFTRFKCGGLAMGFSWSHLLGDAVSAANFVRMYAQILNGNPPPKPHHHQSPQAVPEDPATKPPGATVHPLSVKQAKTLQDRWLPTNELKMGSFSFRVTGTQLKDLQSKASANGRTPFQVISALVWQRLAKFPGHGGEPTVVTVCKSNASAARGWVVSNQQAVGTVRAESPPSQAPLSELARLIAEGFVDESRGIEALVGSGTDGGPHLVVYGANLTFVDLEEIEAYELEVKGENPVFVNYSMDGVGDEGAVLVFQGEKAAWGDGGGRTVNVILPEDQVLHLREELERDWGIA